MSDAYPFFAQRLILASAHRRRRLFLFGIKKTSTASLNAIENIKAHEKTKNAD